MKIRYSAIPVGETFVDLRDASQFIKSSVGRAKFFKGRGFRTFKKHQIVDWVNAWPTQVE